MLSRWKREVVVTLLAVMALGVLTGGGKYVHRYSAIEALSRLVSGWSEQSTIYATHFRDSDSITVATADTSDYIWYPSATGGQGRVGNIHRFTSFHVARWGFEIRDTTTARDGPCSLFVFLNGTAATVESGYVKTCNDTIIFPGASVDISTVPPERWGITPRQTSLGSLVVSSADTIKLYEVWVVGDTL